MRPQLKRIRWAAEFGALYSLFAVSRLVPRGWLLAWGRNLGRLAFRVLRLRRGVVLDNLRQAFGTELDDSSRCDLAARFYQHLGQSLAEFFHLHGAGRRTLLDEVEIEGEEHLRRLRDAQRGAILVSGHFGNWELFGSVLAHRGYPIRYIVKSQSNPWVDRVQNGIRERAGIGIVRMEQAGRGIVLAMRAREYVGILADQDAGSKGVFVDFLGRPASVFRGPAYFAWRSRCPLVPCAIARQPDGRHRVVIHRPIEADPEWDEETAVRELTRRHVDSLAAFIRQWPEQYFWVHRRWKTRPPEERP